MVNWKTTAIGVGSAFAYAFLAQLQGGLKPKDAAIAAGVGLLGAFAKDHDVTGGTKQQASTTQQGTGVGV
jgi:20S proteasome alpha/beta subunit